MSKYKYHFLVFLFFVGIIIGCLINTTAKTDINYSQEVIPIRSSSGDIIGENVIITLPQDFNKEIVSIDASVFDGFYHYSSNDDEFIVNITIDNKSKYDYKYINNTLDISPKSSFDSNNFIYKLIVEGNTVNDSYYRSYNEAILNLIPSNSELSDEVIDITLKNKGYSGIKELNKYYDDYYGKWYSFSLLLDGDVSYYKESNITLIEDAYRYFYSDLLSFSCSGNKFGILKYNYNCENMFSIFNKNSKTMISDMKILLSNNEYFDNYLISVGFNFELFRM